MNKEEKKPAVPLEALRLANIFPFVEKPCDFEEAKASKAYVLWEKSVTDPRSLTREEKDWLFERFCCNVRSSAPNVIHVGGWRIAYPTAKRFLVQDRYDWRAWREYAAFDKTSIRRFLKWCGEIIEYPKNPKERKANDRP